MYWRLQSMLFLTIVLLPSLQAFNVTFENGELGKFELLPVQNKSSVECLEGAQAFVRFARVTAIPEWSVFNVGDEVALKIFSVAKKADMLQAQKGHDYIRKNAPKGFEGVVKAEKFWAESLDLQNDKKLLLPNDKTKESKYFIIIMERLGMDLIGMYETFDPLEEEEVESIYNQLCVIFAELRKINFVHGDIKLQNIMLTKSNVLQDGIKLVDLGLAVFEGSDINSFGGDPIYMNPIQAILERPATNDDDKVSGDFAVIYFGTAYLPWIGFYEDLKCNPNLRYYDFHRERALVAKHDFILNPFAEFTAARLLSQSLEKKIRASIKGATAHEIANVKEKIGVIKALIAGRVRNR